MDMATKRGIMTFDIFYTLPDGSQDSVRLTAETVEAVRAAADEQVKIRGGSDPWSVEVKLKP